jgi:hypothetical protein
MIIDPNGRIAYHAIVFRGDGGSDFVQYGFDGKEIYRHQYSAPTPLIDGGITS